MLDTTPLCLHPCLAPIFTTFSRRRYRVPTYPAGVWSMSAIGRRTPQWVPSLGIHLALLAWRSRSMVSPAFLFTTYRKRRAMANPVPCRHSGGGLRFHQRRSPASFINRPILVVIQLHPSSRQRLQPGRPGSNLHYRCPTLRSIHGQSYCRERPSHGSLALRIRAVSPRDCSVRLQRQQQHPRHVLRCGSGRGAGSRRRLLRAPLRASLPRPVPSHASPLPAQTPRLPLHRDLACRDIEGWTRLRRSFGRCAWSPVKF